MYREYQSAGKLELIIWCDGRRQDHAYNKRPTAETNEPVARKRARTSCNDLTQKPLMKWMLCFSSLMENIRENFPLSSYEVGPHDQYGKTHIT